MPKEKKTVGFEVTADIEKDIRTKLGKMDGATNAEKLVSALSVAAAVKARNEMGEEYRDHIDSIEASIENIRTSATAIARAAAEELRLATEELRAQLLSKEKTIRDLQHEREKLETKLGTALTAKNAAEEAATEAKSEAERAVADKAFIQQAARDKDELIALLRQKVAGYEAQGALSEVHTTGEGSAEGEEYSRDAN